MTRKTVECLIVGAKAIAIAMIVACEPTCQSVESKKRTRMMVELRLRTGQVRASQAIAVRQLMECNELKLVHAEEEEAEARIDCD